MNSRCCGSIIRAPCGVKPKKSASNSSMRVIRAARLTYEGLDRAASETPAATRSASESPTMDSTPSRRLRQNVDSESAPGNRPAIPTTAIASKGGAPGDEMAELLFTRLVLPSAASRLLGAPRHVVVLWHADRWGVGTSTSSECPTEQRHRQPGRPRMHPGEAAQWMAR